MVNNEPFLDKLSDILLNLIVICFILLLGFNIYRAIYTPKSTNTHPHTERYNLAKVSSQNK